MRTAENIETKLRRAWRKERKFFHTRGLSCLFLWLAALAALSFLVDWLFLLPGYARAALGLASLGVLAWVAWDKWLRHLRRFDPVRVALQVERRHPELNSLLISYVQIDEAPRAGDTISPGIIQAFRREAVRTAAGIDFRDIIDYRELKRILLFACAVLVTCAVLSANWSDYFRTFVLRMTQPGVALAYPTRTQIVELTGDQTIRQGTPITLSAVGAGRIPPEGRLLVQSGHGPWEELPLARKGEAAFEHRFGEVFESFNYFVRLGDAQSAVHRVHVIPPPRIVQSRVRITYPEYTGLAAREVDSLNLEVPEGAALDWQITCDRPLAEGQFVREGGTGVPLELDASGRTGRISLTASNAFVYQFHWTEREHGYSYEGGVNYFVNVLPDTAPEVALLQPDENEKATVRKRVNLAFRANDDYAVSQAWIVYSVNQEPEQKQLLGDFNQAAVESGGVWPVRNAIPSLKEGDVITYAIEVADNRIGEAGPNLSRSRSLQLSIVSVEEYTRYILEKQARLVKEVEALRKEEQTASREVQALQQTPLALGPLRGDENGQPAGNGGEQ